MMMFKKSGPICQRIQDQDLLNHPQGWAVHGGIPAPTGYEQDFFFKYSFEVIVTMASKLY